MHRRRLLQLCAGSLAASALPKLLPALVQEGAGRTGVGLVTYTQRFRGQWLREKSSGRDLFQPLAFLERCRELGAGGMQADLGRMTPEEAGSLRRRIEDHDMYLEAIVRLPRDETDVERFRAELRTAALAGARAARTVVLGGRRYERFKTLEEFREFSARARRMLELAAPVAEAHRVPLAVENHKDQRVDERLELLRRISSEHVGACVDTGNSFALLEDPMEVVAAFAPWAYSVHLKDQAVQEYEAGFLLADIPLGRGMFDLAGMVKTLRSKKPDIRFSLELITRDPLKVPCLTDTYWATMPKVSGRDLARTLRIVRERAASSLPSVSSLTLAEQVAREEANVRESLAYARQHLGL